MDEQARRDRSRRVRTQIEAATALLRRLADRMTPDVLDPLLDTLAGGESGAAVNRICGILVREQRPITPAERDAVAALLDMFDVVGADRADDMTDIPYLVDRAGTLAHLNVVEPSSAGDTSAPLRSAIRANERLLDERVATIRRVLGQVADRIPDDEREALERYARRDTSTTSAERLARWLVDHRVPVDPAERDGIMAMLALHAGLSPTNTLVARRFPHVLDPDGTLARLHVVPRPDES